MIEILSLIISLSALGFTVWQYFVHGRKIERQQVQLNQLELEKHQKEREDAGRACIRANIVAGSKGGNRTLRIFNAGKAEARNVRVEWLNESKEVFVRGDFSALGNLTPQNSRSFCLALTSAAPEVMQLRYTWQDDCSDTNTLEEQVQL